MRVNHLGFFLNWLIVIVMYFFKVYTFEFTFFLTITLGIFWLICAIDDIGDKKILKLVILR